MRRQTRISAEAMVSAEARYGPGETLRAIAKDSGVSRQRLGSLLREPGVRLRGSTVVRGARCVTTSSPRASTCATRMGVRGKTGDVQEAARPLSVGGLRVDFEPLSFPGDVEQRGQ